MQCEAEYVSQHYKLGKTASNIKVFFLFRIGLYNQGAFMSKLSA